MAKYLNDGRLLEFTSARKIMSWVVPTYGDNDDKIGYVVYTKGAPEVIIMRCDRVYSHDQTIIPLDDKERKRILHVTQSYGKKGMRCLALAHRDNLSVNANLNAFDDDMQNSNGSKAWKVEMLIGALVGIIDSLRG